MLQPSPFLRKDLPMDHHSYLLFFLMDLRTPWYWANTMPMKRIELQTRIIVTTLVISPTSLRHALQWPDVLDLKTFISQSCQSTLKNHQCSWWQRMEMLKSLIHHSRYLLWFFFSIRLINIYSCQEGQKWTFEIYY